MAAPARPMAIRQIAIFVAVIGVPLAGAALAGNVPAELFRFPPLLQIPTDYLRFSWLAAAAVVLALALLTGSWLAGARNVPATSQQTSGGPVAKMNAGRLPMWGWIAVAWT